MNQPTDRDINLSIASDLHKDLYCSRPRGAAWEFYANLSDEELSAELARMSEKVEAQIDWEAQRRADNRRAFNRDVVKLMGDHNISRADAVRWLADAENCLRGRRVDVERLCWKFDLGYRFDPFTGEYPVTHKAPQSNGWTEFDEMAMGAYLTGLS